MAEYGSGGRDDCTRRHRRAGLPSRLKRAGEVDWVCEGDGRGGEVLEGFRGEEGYD
jgi:hypothetical protein